MARRLSSLKGRALSDEVRRIIRDGNGCSDTPLKDVMRDMGKRAGGGGFGGGMGMSSYPAEPPGPTPLVTPDDPIGPIGRVVEPEGGADPPEVTRPGEEGTA